MKYVLAGLAIVAAALTLVFRPPQIGSATAPVSQDPSLSQPVALPQSGAGRKRSAPRLQRIVVYVAGSVRQPGVYDFPPDSRAVDAVARAGGSLPDADLVAVNLAARLNDGDEIAVPKIGENTHSSRGTRAVRARTTKGERGRKRHRRAESDSGTEQSLPLIDLNSADANALEGVPGIGPGLAARIVAYRSENGPFASLDELADVAGITPRLQDALTEFVFVR